MSRVTLALGSFMLGACFMYLWGFRTSITAQSASAQIAPTENKSGYGTAIIDTSAEPAVPPLHMPLMKGARVGFQARFQPLDGINCEGCVFEAEALTYAGEAFRCINCKIKGDRVELKGAALNTFKLFTQVTNFLNAPEGPGRNIPGFRIAAGMRNTGLTLVSATK